MKFLVRYWAQITGIVMALAMVFGWLWHMKTRLDDYVSTQNDLVKRMQVVESQSAEHDQDLDDHNDKLLVLNKIEELREKGLMK